MRDNSKVLQEVENIAVPLPTQSAGVFYFRIVGSEDENVIDLIGGQLEVVGG